MKRLVIVILAILAIILINHHGCYTNAESTDPLSSITSTGLDEDEEDEELTTEKARNYEVLIYPSADSIQKEGHGKRVRMMYRGTPFYCYIPNVNDTNPENKPAAATIQDTPLLMRIAREIDNQCYYFGAGWWWYEFCSKKHFRQFHQDQQQQNKDEQKVPDSNSASFMLGLTNGQSLDALHVRTHVDTLDPPSSYIAVRLSGGSPCDITNQPRESEIRFACPTDEQLARVKPNLTAFLGETTEPATCQYVSYFYLKSLCHHPAFKKRVVISDNIQCYPIVNESPKATTLDTTKLNQDDAKRLQDVMMDRDDTLL